MAGVKSISVKAGDTLQSIAMREFGDAKRFGDLGFKGDPKTLKPGMILQVSNDAYAQPSATPDYSSKVISTSSTPNATTPSSAPIGTTPVQNTVAPTADQFAASNANRGTIGSPTTPAPVAPIVTAPAASTVPTIGIPNAPTPPLSVNGNGVTAPTYTPNAIVAPTVQLPQATPGNIPQYKGGDQTRDMVNELKMGTRVPNPYSTNIAEKEAAEIYQSYVQHKDMNSSQLIDAFTKGTITPDPNNLLWTTLYTDGKPSSSLIEAYAKWDIYEKQQKLGLGLKREQNPFLGGKFNQLTSLDQANTDLNDAQNKAMNGKASLESPTSSDTGSANDVTVTPSQRAYYDNLLQTQFKSYIEASNVKAPVSEYQKKLQESIEKYGVTSLEDQLTQLDAQLAKENDFMKRQRDALMNDPNATLDVVHTRLNEGERQGNDRISALNIQKQTRVDQLKTRYSIIDMIGKAYDNDYDATRANWEDEYARQKDITSALSGQVKAEGDYENQVRDDARLVANTMYNNFTSGGLDATALTPEMKLKFNELEAKGGFPQGTYEALMVKNPKADVVGNPYTRIDANGDRWTDITTIDRKTGKFTTQSVFDGQDATALAKNALTTAQAGLTEAKTKMTVAEANLLPEKERREWAKVNGFSIDPKTGKVIETLASKQLAEKTRIDEAKLTIARQREKAYESRVATLNSGGTTGSAKIPPDIEFKRLLVNQMLTANEKAIANYDDPPYDEATINAYQKDITDYLDKKKSNPVGLGSGIQARTTVTGKFGAQYRAGVEANKSGTNQGTDLRFNAGTPLYLPSQGTWKVVKAISGVTGGNLKDYKKAPYGNSVLVQNTQTGEKLRYSHLDDVAVSEGDILDPETQLGLTGGTGNVSGAHLDLEYYAPGNKLGDVMQSPYGSYYVAETPAATPKKGVIQKTSEAVTSAPAKANELLSALNKLATGAKKTATSTTNRFL